MAKLASNIDLNSMRSSMPKKIPPIETLAVPRKPKKLNFNDSLVAPIQKTYVPNHVLNTSKQIHNNKKIIFELNFLFYLKRNLRQITTK